MLVYHSPNALDASVELLSGVVLSGTPSASVYLSLLPIAVVDGDTLSIRHRIRLWKRARCDAGHLIGTSAGCTLTSCALWGRVVAELGLRHVFGQFWESGSSPRVTLRVLEVLQEDLMILVRRDWVNFKDGRHAVETYTKAHVQHAHLLMITRSSADVEVWHSIPMLINTVAVTILSEDPVYNRAISNRLAQEDWLNTPVLMMAFTKVAGELTAVGLVDTSMLEDVRVDPKEAQCS